MSRAAIFSQAALSRVLKAYQDMGIPVDRLQTVVDGQGFKVLPIDPASAPVAGGRARNPLDRVFAK